MVKKIICKGSDSSRGPFECKTLVLPLRYSDNRENISHISNPFTISKLYDSFIELQIGGYGGMQKCIFFNIPSLILISFNFKASLNPKDRLQMVESLSEFKSMKN